MMKTIKKIVCIIIVNILLLGLIELSSYIYVCNKNKDLLVLYNKAFNNKCDNKECYFIGYPPIRNASINEIANKRPVEWGKKKPIVLFGCSFIEGTGLTNDETISHKLAEYSDRTIINRGLSSSGITHMYWQLNQNKIISIFPSDTEYFIYNFIDDHLNRLYSTRSGILDSRLLPKYKIKNGKLVEIKPIVFLHKFFTSYIIEEIVTKIKRKDINGTKKLTTELFNESYKIIKNKFPNAKFVLLVMDNDIDMKFFSDLDKNIIIVRVPVYEDKKYYIEDNIHPSALYWDEVVPYISKELNL